MGLITKNMDLLFAAKEEGSGPKVEILGQL